MMKDIVKAIDRLAATILLASLISRKDTTISGVDITLIDKVIKDNIYLKV